MPSILALDTSTDVCSVALLHDGQVYESVSHTAREHTQRLLPMIEALLADHQVTLKNLDAIAFGRGPGSFTGLRICLSVAQGLAYGADLPLIGVSSLLAMSRQAQRLERLAPGTCVIPIIDARMDEVYWSAYRCDEQQGLIHLAEEQVATPEQSCDDILQLQAETICAVGSGWHYPVLQALPNVKLHPDIYPSAYDMAEIAVESFERKDFLSPLEAQPHYLRNEINWKKRQRIRET